MASDRHQAAIKAWETRGRAQGHRSMSIQQSGDFASASAASQADQPNPSDYEQFGGVETNVRRPDGTWHPKPVSERYLMHQEQWEKTRPGASHPVLASGLQGKKWLRRIAVRQKDNGPEETVRYKADYEYRDKHGELVDVAGMKLKPYDRADAMLHQMRGGNPLHPPDWAN